MRNYLYLFQAFNSAFVHVSYTLNQIDYLKLSSVEGDFSTNQHPEDTPDRRERNVGGTTRCCSNLEA